ncbi:hypothetical protein G4B88_029197 [Cannabis sativa]|uniref:RNase H type-1 domain-containing protein n=1 Tax=Cannabis sativa TaxID=3483 RepID=A0A7J6H120_CANSA|nr:hypothetical protein G4B88_029197 [Cannabis sativa]
MITPTCFGFGLGFLQSRSIIADVFFSVKVSSCREAVVHEHIDDVGWGVELGEFLTTLDAGPDSSSYGAIPRTDGAVSSGFFGNNPIPPPELSTFERHTIAPTFNPGFTCPAPVDAFCEANQTAFPTTAIGVHTNAEPDPVPVQDIERITKKSKGKVVAGAKSNYHGSKTMQANILLERAISYLHEYHEANTSLQRPMNSPPTSTLKLQPPPQETFKLNVDASICQEKKIMGIGGIIRDSNGLVIAAILKLIHGLWSVTEIEAKVVSACLHWASDLGISIHQLETDSLIVANYTNNYHDQPSRHNDSICDINYQLTFFLGASLNHISCYSNVVAHGLVRFALRVDSDYVWRANIPGQIDQTLAAAVNQFLTTLDAGADSSSYGAIPRTDGAVSSGFFGNNPIPPPELSTFERHNHCPNFQTWFYLPCSCGCLLITEKSKGKVVAGAKSNYHGSKTMQANILLERAISYLHEYHEANTSLQRPMNSPPTSTLKLQPPPQETFKLNVDASICQEKKIMGIGGIIRDSNGLVIAAILKLIHGLWSVTEIEAKVVSACLHWASDLGISIHQLERTH